MGSTINRCLPVFAAVLLALAVSEPPVHARSLGEQWKEADGEAVQSILAGKYKEAEKTLDAVVDEMLERLGPGVGGKHAMGLVLMHRALAEVGLGERRKALWDWHVALNFNPLLRDEDLSGFGELGGYLKRNPLRTPDRGEGDSPQKDGQEGASPLTPEIDPPKARKRPRPKFPFGAKFFGVQGPIVVQVIVTHEGEVIQPVVLKDLDVATISYSALEALRQWKFRPARLNGVTVAVFYNLTVNYRLR